MTAKEKLTPIYAAFYILPRVSGNNLLACRTRRLPHGGEETLPGTLDDARKDIARCQARGLPALLYQYGWKQRGFRGSEFSDGIREENAALADLRAHPERNAGSVGF